MPVAPARVVFANRQKPGIFALRSGIRLEANPGEPGDFRQPVFEVPEEVMIARRLFVRDMRMQF